MLKNLLILLALIGTPALSGETTMGDDGLHKTDWMRDTFRDISEDLEEATAEGKRFMVIIEQRGCIYCTKMHEQVFPDPDIKAIIEENYFVVQINMFGDIDVTDFDGETLSEKEMIRKWGIVFTPTMMFFDEQLPAEGTTAAHAAVMTMPGAFGKFTTLSMFRYILEKGYEGDEHFQKYVARIVAERNEN